MLMAAAWPGHEYFDFAERCWRSWFARDLIYEEISQDGGDV